MTLRQVARVTRVHESDSRRTIVAVQSLYGAVSVDLTDVVVDQSGEQPLRLAERVAKEDRRAASLLVRAPPVPDVGEDLGVIAPAVDRESERALGDERVAALELEGRAGRIGIGLV